ncbi:MAG: hypothetical protein A3F15_01300 [Candidatus Wildermuthbacteria bacterium RIFCSPHIGHO2_12_FULL_40_12]|uniref:Uncharacterized protein n=1 Tax=Candidatus Wildermuthbacteria bacterium RIFCSPHIGHO2_12_FULL_40_12 TaxID=1802457 RepID=A0A1G2RC81_9BACT|nr:MAG: hypothetical protein A3F15_01300 [Candidatus Wildermuthbacteria bacterium RIFCSPHIGHO2_12_FULL_40_12]
MFQIKNEKVKTNLINGLRCLSSREINQSAGPVEQFRTNYFWATPIRNSSAGLSALPKISK